MRDCPSVRRARLGLFTTAEAAAAGWTAKQLDYAVRCGRLVRPRRGIYAPSFDGEVSARTRDLMRARQAVAASMTNRAAFVSHLSAATVRGWPTWAVRSASACVVVPTGTSRVRGVHVHRGPGAPGDFVRRADVRMTAAGRTIVDIAREFGIESALVSADAALARQELDRLGLAAAIDRAAGQPGIERARKLLALVDPLAESPLESRSHWQLYQHGVTPPLSQVDIIDTDGNFLARVDGYWPEGVVGEVDGSMKYTDSSVLRREKWRQEKLERVRLRVVRWGDADLARFGPTAQRIEAARGEARADTRPRGWWAVRNDAPGS